ncbi:hypothetical protein IX51_09425 [uncultured archaeon]|nr:hypothetical protein IX51_09425 [uncultured archaeon]
MYRNRRRQNDSFDYLFLLPGTLPYPTGGHKVTYELCRGLSRMGYNVGLAFINDVYKEIYLVDKDPLVKSFLKKRKYVFRLYETIVNTKIGFRTILPILRFLMRIEYKEELDDVRLFFSFKQVSRHCVERAIAASWQTSFLLTNMNGAKRKYYLIHHHEDEISFSDYVLPLASKSYGLDLKKIVINEKTYDKFRDSKPIRTRIGHDIEKYHSNIPPENRIADLVVFPLREGLDKGSEIALQVAAGVAEKFPNARLVSFGNYRPKDIPKGVEHLGFINDKDLIKLLGNATVFFLPSLIEGFSLIGIEAMAAGVAVVSIDNGGVREYLNDGQNGMLVYEDYINNSISVISRLLTQRDLRIKLAKAGFETAKLYSFEYMHESFFRAISEYERQLG